MKYFKFVPIFILTGLSLFLFSCPCPHLCDDAVFSIGFTTDNKDDYTYPIIDTIGKNIDTFYVIVYENWIADTVDEELNCLKDFSTVHATTCIDCIYRLSIDKLICNTDIIIKNVDTIKACTNLINDKSLKLYRIDNSRIMFTKDVELPLGEVIFQVEGNLDRVGRIKGTSKLIISDSVSIEYAFGKR